MVGGQGGKSAVGGGEREGRRVDWGGGERGSGPEGV